MKINKLLPSLLLTFCLAIVAFVPTIAYGAIISIEPRGSLPALGDTAIFDVYLNTDGQTINAIDGSIMLVDQNKLSFQNCFTANSVFSFWPSQPAYNARNKTISFIGGVPGGIKVSHGLLFSLVFSAKDSGEAALKPQRIMAYLNNEKATSIIATNHDLNFSIAAKDQPGMKNDWQALIAIDKTPPQPFTITLNQDQNLFAGQKFISFMTTDNETGIDYYEIKEGKFPPERAEIQYVLQDQTLNSDVTVTAYDRAGNKQVATLSRVKKTVFEQNYLVVACWILGSIIVLLFLFVIMYKYIKMKKK